MQVSFERLSQNFGTVQHPSVALIDNNDAASVPPMTEIEPSVPTNQPLSEAEKIADNIKLNLPLIKPAAKKRSNRLDKVPELTKAFDRLISDYSRTRQSPKASLELRQSCKLKLEPKGVVSEKELRNKLLSPRKTIKKCSGKNL